MSSQKFLFVFLLLIHVMCFGAPKTSHSDVVYPRQLAQKIKASLPEGWTMYSDGLRIYLHKQKPVRTLVRGFSSPPSLGSLEKDMKRYGKEIHFFMVLEFTTRFSDKQINELYYIKDKAAAYVKNDNMKHSKRHSEYSKYKMPKYYNDKYSVFETVVTHGAIAPDSAAEEVQTVKSLITTHLTPYPHIVRQRVKRYSMTYLIFKRLQRVYFDYKYRLFERRLS